MNGYCYILHFIMVFTNYCLLPPPLCIYVSNLIIFFGCAWGMMTVWDRQRLAKLIPGLRPWEVLSIEQAMDRITFNGEWYREPLGSYTTGPPYLKRWDGDVMVCLSIKAFGFIYYLYWCFFSLFFFYMIIIVMTCHSLPNFNFPVSYLWNKRENVCMTVCI